MLNNVKASQTWHNTDKKDIAAACTRAEGDIRNIKEDLTSATQASETLDPEDPWKTLAWINKIADPVEGQKLKEVATLIKDAWDLFKTSQSSQSTQAAAATGTAPSSSGQQASGGQGPSQRSGRSRGSLISQKGKQTSEPVPAAPVAAGGQGSEPGPACPKVQRRRRDADPHALQQELVRHKRTPASRGRVRERRGAGPHHGPPGGRRRAQPGGRIL